MTDDDLFPDREVMNLGPEQRAHHEAGHAVAAHCLGLKIDFVFLSMDNAENSKCQRLDLFDDSRLEESMLNEIRFLLAGIAADRRHFGDEMPDEPLPGWGQDRIDSRVLAEMVAGNRGIAADSPGLPDAVDKILGTEQDRANGFVRSNWSAVDAVAAELLARGKLPGDEVHDIIRRASTA